ncbi:MAG: deoxyribose-phosphate aldolase [Bacillota bacterium]|nr:deoxyribose-phosphate aldolase [Bacillota bacterium]MDW7728414.1 deoxyribose-phosphate aldolase [Bacillota bacterium]
MSENMASYIDHTLLKPEATREQIITLCREALKYNFYSVCINPSYVKTAVEILENSDVKVCAVVGFPLGATTSAVKAFEAREAVENGAAEIDMVIHIGALKDGDKDYVLRDIASVVKSAVGNTVKVIIETGLLSDEEKKLACLLAKEAGAHFVKTSTGFGAGGATPSDIQLMRETVGAEFGVKASGGVRTPDSARAMIEAGATRIGTSSGIKIVESW